MHYLFDGGGDSGALMRTGRCVRKDICPFSDVDHFGGDLGLDPAMGLYEGVV